MEKIEAEKVEFKKREGEVLVLRKANAKVQREAKAKVKKEVAVRLESEKVEGLKKCSQEEDGVEISVIVGSFLMFLEDGGQAG